MKHLSHILLLSFFLILSLNFISSEEITLSNLSLNYSQIFCLGVGNNIQITPLDNNNNYVNVTSINYTIPKNFKTSGIYYFNESYNLLIFLDSNLTFPGKYNVSFSVNQRGKTIIQDINITVDNCFSLKESTIGLTQSIDDFLSRNKDVLILIVGVIILLILFWILVRA